MWKLKPEPPAILSGKHFIYSHVMWAEVYVSMWKDIHGVAEKCIVIWNIYSKSGNFFFSSRIYSRRSFVLAFSIAILY